MRRVLIVSPGNDIAGIGFALKAAFDRHAPDWQVRAVRRQDKWFDYPADIRWIARHDPHTQRMVGELWQAADVVHLMETFGDQFPWPARARVIHHHGAIFTQSPQPIIDRAQAEGLPLLVSTFDMMAWGGVEWLPNPCDTEHMARLRRRYQRGPRPRVVHSPSSRGPKATENFLTAFEALGGRADLELIERVPWAECLERKATGDILFDQLLIGYALSSIEAWGLGLAVLSGAADPSVTERTREALGFLPYLDTTAETLAADLARLVDDRDLRGEYVERGREAIARFHDERQVVRRLIGIYERALDEQVAA